MRAWSTHSFVTVLLGTAFLCVLGVLGGKKPFGRYPDIDPL
jgi:hypothetical protein